MARSNLVVMVRYFCRPGCPASSRRQIRFLVRQGGALAIESFESEKARMSRAEWRALNARLDEWVQFPDRAMDKKKAHGWDRSLFGGRYVDCWVFKAGSFRLYGVLCHPERRNPRLEVFVPTCVVPKHEWEANTTFLDRAVRVLQGLNDSEWVEG